MSRVSTVFEQATRVAPRGAEEHNNRGVVRQARGDLDGALADFEEALRLAPNYVEAHNNRGVVRHERGDPAGALADFDRALELNPRYANAYYNRGTAHAALNDFARALALDDAVARADLAGQVEGRVVGLLLDLERNLRLFVRPWPEVYPSGDTSRVVIGLPALRARDEGPCVNGPATSWRRWTGSVG